MYSLHYTSSPPYSLHFNPIEQNHYYFHYRIVIVNFVVFLQ